MTLADRRKQDQKEVRRLLLEIKQIASKLTFGHITKGDATARLDAIVDEMNVLLEHEFDRL